MEMHHKHKKRSLRFIVFFIMLVVYSIVEDIIALSITGIDIDFILQPKHMFLIILVAVVFTIISEITEELYRKKSKKK